MSEENADKLEKLLNDGLGYHDAGDIARARDLYLKVLEIDPQNSKALDLAGLLCMQCGELEAAKDFYTSAISIEPKNTRFLLHLGILLLDQGDITESEKVLREIIVLDSNHADCRFYIAIGMRADNRHEAAKEMLETAWSLNRESAIYSKWLGLLSMETGDLVSALEYSKISIELDGTDITCFVQIGAIFAALDDFELAEKAYRSGLEVNKTDIRCRAELAGVLVELGRLDEAKTEIDYIMNEGGRDSASALANAALLESLGEDKQKARIDIEKAIELGPKSLDVLLSAFKVFNNIKDIDRSASILDQMQSIAADDARVLSALLS
jgi:tetratricopeptide (TPR) repeat protein